MLMLEEKTELLALFGTEARGAHDQGLVVLRADLGVAQGGLGRGEVDDDVGVLDVFGQVVDHLVALGQQGADGERARRFGGAPQGEPAALPDDVGDAAAHAARDARDDDSSHACVLYSNSKESRIFWQSFRIRV